MGAHCDGNRLGAQRRGGRGTRLPHIHGVQRRLPAFRQLRTDPNPDCPEQSLVKELVVFHRDRVARTSSGLGGGEPGRHLRRATLQDPPIWLALIRTFGSVRLIPLNTG